MAGLSTLNLKERPWHEGWRAVIGQNKAGSPRGSGLYQATETIAFLV